MSRLAITRQAKVEKRQQLEAAGVTVHPHSFDKQQSIADCQSMMEKHVQTAGRIKSIRYHGKLVFATLADPSGQIQLLLRKESLGDSFAQLTLIDPGDFLGVSGVVTHSKTGELSIEVDSFTFLGKALRPLPTSFNAAENKEVRFRKRYLDILINPETKRVLDARWQIEKEIRRFLQDAHNYVEVETPVFHPLYGGTNAKPFTTHMNALDTDFYLRLAPELYLKRLIVAGYERIFEIARNFRNEGIDQTHQPEFTMIEWYETYADYTRMMDVAEALLKHLATAVNGNLQIQVEDSIISLEGEWPRISMKAALQTHLNVDVDALNDDQLQKLSTKHELEVIGEFTRGKAVFALFDKLVTPKLIQPTWVIDYPRDVSPLAKQHRANPELAERFELYIAGREIADGWSEITDALDQRQIFDNEQKRMRQGDAEAHPLDEDFLEAMEYGMPPLGGIGIGIDRLVMFLTNTWSIREVVAFPTLRPLKPFIAPQAKNIATREIEPIELPKREQSESLLKSHIKNEKLLHHCYMVAQALEAYATKLGEDPELWYATGLLHDLDWEEFPDEHPNKAIKDWFGAYPESMKHAIAAHAPSRTGVEPSTTLDNYLFACDELSGFLHAYSLMRPEGFAGMKVSSVTKKLKDKSFAANVSREDIYQGEALIGIPLSEHIAFLIELFDTKA